MACQCRRLRHKQLQNLLGRPALQTSHKRCFPTSFNRILCWILLAFMHCIICMPGSQSTQEPSSRVLLSWHSLGCALGKMAWVSKYLNDCEQEGEVGIDLGLSEP